MIIASFTRVFHQTAIGSKQVITDIALNPALLRVTGRPIETVTGFGPIAVGSGTQTRILVGRRIITDVGFGFLAKGGAGFRATNGRRPGFPGGRAAIIAAGRRYLLTPGLASIPASPVGLIAIMESGRPLTRSSISRLGASQAICATPRRRPRTYKSSGRRRTSPTSGSKTP